MKIFCRLLSCTLVLSLLCCAALAEGAPITKDNVFDTYNATTAYVPLMTQCGSAVQSDGGFTKDGELVLIYSNATRQDYQQFLTMCSFIGLYRYELPDEDGESFCFLFKPGTNYNAIVSYSPKDKELLFQTVYDGVDLGPEQMNAIADYYLQDLSFPADFGLNVAPQFYVSVNQRPSWQNVVSGVSYAFDNASCWSETYMGISYAQLEQYASDMILCGFDVYFDHIKLTENNVPSEMILHFTNGDLETIVTYFASSQTATVYYKPGVMMYLLSVSEYTRYIPQR